MKLDYWQWPGYLNTEKIKDNWDLKYMIWIEKKVYGCNYRDVLMSHTKNVAIMWM